jgi:hypothetical protein
MTTYVLLWLETLNDIVNNEPEPSVEKPGNSKKLTLAQPEIFQKLTMVAQAFIPDYWFIGHWLLCS